MTSIRPYAALPVLLVTALVLLVLSAGPAEAVPPGNDGFFFATPMTLGSSAFVSSTVDATEEPPNEPAPGCQTNIDKTVWYRYNALQNGTVTVITANSTFDTVVGVYRATKMTPQITDLVQVGCDDDDLPASTSTASFSAFAGQTYFIQIGGFSNANGALNVGLGTLYPHDNLASAAVATIPYSTPYDTGASTNQAGEAFPCATGNALWFKATLPAGNYVAKNGAAPGSFVDSTMAIYTGPVSSPTFPLTQVDCADDTFFPTTNVDSTIYFLVTVPATYYFQVGGLGGARDNMVFTLNVNPDADGDGVADPTDNCPSTANGPLQELSPGVGNQADNDSDAVPGTQPPANAGWGGDACDTDDDDDGAADTLDGCPFSPEDFDQWEDGDGCEDPDNDSDGICDTGLVSISCTGSDFGRYLWKNPLGAQVDCRNVAEDIDAFHDNDGCPEPDNDYDNFPDGTDDCPATDTTAGADGISDTGDDLVLYLVPYQAREDFDGIIDTDGCHDSPNDDYDGDGLGDETEVFTVQTDPVNPDTDSDARVDGSDNCPNWSNAAQNLPPWTVPANDFDCDGFNTVRELHVNTDPTKHCNATSTFNDEADAWPTDFNDSRFTTLADVSLINPSYNKFPGDGGYNQRFDLNASNGVTLADVSLINPFYNKSCS